MQKTKILIVEDESIIAMELEERLAQLGCEVVGVALDSNTALQKAAEHLPDIVMMDIQIKGPKDGIETAAEIRAQFSIPVIYITAYADKETTQRAKLTQPFGYLIKPFRENEIRVAIEMTLYRRETEKRLRESEEHFRGVVQSASDAILSADSAGNIIGWNPAAEGIFGYAEVEILGQPITLFLPLRYHQEHLNGMARVTNGGEKHVIGKTVELEGRRKNGSEFSLELSLSEWQSGGDKFYTAIIRDISGRKLAEAKMHMQTVALESAADGITITDKHGTIEWINPAWSAMTGYSAQEAIGKNPRILKSGKHPPEFYRDLWNTILAGKTWRGELINRRKDGALYTEEEIITPVLDEHGQIKNFIAIKRDITERKQMEEAQQESERFARATIDALSAHLAILDETGAIISVNRAWRNFAEANSSGTTDIAHEGVNYLSVCEVSSGPKSEEALAMAAGIRSVMSGKQTEFSLEYPCHSPVEKRWFNAHVTRFSGEGALRIVVAHENITGRKQAEEELRKRERFLALLNDMTHTIISAQNFKEMAETLTKNITVLLEADHCYITRWDPLKEQVFPVAANARLTQPYTNTVFEKGEKNLTTSALEAGTIIVAEDIETSPHTSRQITKNFATKSAISIPLIYAGNKLGAVIVAFEKYHHFMQEELERAEQAGNQIALAVWNMQQEFELQRNLHEARALADIALALSETERIGLSDVLNLIVVSAQKLISNAKQVVIHLFDEKEQTLTYGAVIGFDDLSGGKKKMHLGEGIAGQAILSGETVNITDVAADPRFLKLGVDPTYRSLLVAPVLSGQRRLGTISIQSDLPFAFSANDINLLNQLATQAAIAIENAHLLESIQLALKESKALYRINQGLVASLDPQELLKDVVDLLQKNFGYYHVQIYVLEPESGDFIMREGSGEIGRQLKEQEHRLHAGEGIVGYTAETDAAFFTNDVDEMISFTRNPLLPDTKSELAVPVKIDNQILGLLDIHQMPPTRLTENDLQLVSAVANQLAIALQKAKLYSDLQAALQVETAIRHQMIQSERLVTMGRLLASVSHELNNPLQAIQNALYLLQEEKGISAQGKSDLDIVVSEAERMSILIERLRDTYRPIQAEDFLPTQINKIVEDIYALTSTHLNHNQIAYEFYPDPELPVIHALPNQIRQVILNLIMNAVEAMSTGGKLTILTKWLPDSDEVLLTVSDSGPGISDHLMSNIFDAFVTNKKTGTGLGLTISYDIVMKHNGNITAENNADAGALFKVWFPIHNSEIE